MTVPSPQIVNGIDIESLEIVASWRVDLTQRVRRAHLQYELVGLSAEEVIALSAEAESFKRACQMLRGDWAR